MATSGGQTLGVTISANMDPSGVLSAIKTIQSGFNGLKIDPKLMDGLTKEFSEVQKLVKDYQKIMGKENISKADLKNLQKLEGSINSSFSRIIELQNQINSKNIVLKVDATQLDELHKKTEAARQALNDTFGKVNIGNSTNGLIQIENALEKAVGRSKTLKTSLTEAFESLNKGEVSQFNNKLDNIFNNLTSKIKAGKLIPTVDNLLNSFKQLGLIDVKIKTDSAAEKLLALKNGVQALKDGIANGLNGEELKGLIKNLEDATKAEKEFETAAIKRGQDNLSKRVGDTQRLAAATREATKAQTEFQQATLSAQDQVRQLQQSTQYFFSLRNMINLLKRGIREAVDTVKELDAAMTETAVVTNFSVGDMWKKLPEYTANANALGATVKDMYEATTLYYQQGLNTEQAMGIASETMKMARIGGLEAADATDKMTAALRGFNMELSEASAQRVNDVYSNLAAKTASNTEELGTAMQRTASIAASAGMSFEGTAAFLAQAIETTREPAENLGTAMKTIVARFQELKKNPLEITEVDGEEVDYNKVDTALKSIGVSLKDANGQFRDLDKVFLEISQKWDGLSQTQQRYIATTAAGSRQQSRFIAMMSNYERTMQLMDFANNSAGASTEQFNKTLESLEAKLNKFQNAWKQFLMGIMNDSWTKGIVDAGTTVLNIVNKLINALSFGGKIKGIKSILSIFTAFTALKMAGRGVNGLIGGLGGFLDPKSTFSSGFKRGISQGAAANAAGRITTPILAKLDQLIAAVRGKQGLSQQDKISTVADYNRAASAFQRVGIDKSLTMEQTGDLFKNLSSAHAIAAFNSGSGTVSAMRRTSKDWFSNIASQVGLDARSQKIGQQLMGGIYKGMKKGEISPSEGIKLLGRPEKWGKAFGTPVAKEFSKNFLTQVAAQRKSVNQKLFNQAKKAAFTQMGGSAFANLKDIDAFYANPARSKEEIVAFKKAQREIFKKLRQENIAQNGGLGNIPILPQTNLEQLGTKVSQVGQKFTSAGFSIQMFGQQLSMLSPALSGVGNAITMVGTAVSTLGMGMTALGGLPAAITRIVGALGGLATALPVFVAVGTAIGAIAYDVIKVQNIKKAAQTVVDSFKEINESTSENIANLESWESEFANLSKGVDKNGNNINLNTDEYDRYKEIANSIAEINPSIVEGYNAQGDAIIDNNKALSETLELQKRIRKEAIIKYTSNTSLNKLIKARDENEDLFVTKKGDKYSKSREAFSALKGQLKGQIDFDMLTKQLGFDITTATEETIGRNYQLIANSISSLLSDEAPNEIWQALDDFTEAEKTKYEATEDIYKALSTYAEDQRYTTIVPEILRNQYQLGLKNQALVAKSAQEAKSFAKDSAKKLQALGGENSEVGKILAEIKKTQEQYDKDLNEEAYSKAINSSGLIGQLEAIRDKYEESSDAQKRSYAEMITSMIEEANRYTSTAGADLIHAFNTSKNAIDAMSSAYDEFSKALEGGSVEKATEGLKKIYDEMTSGTNNLYGGNKTYWLGAKNFVSEEVFERGNFKETNGIIKELIPALEDTEAGYQAAGYYIADIAKDIQNSTDKEIQELSKYLEPTAEGGFKIAEGIPTEAIERIAQFRGIDSNILRTLLTKVSRIASFKMWDFEEAKKGYYGDERVIQAEGKNGEEGKIYIKQGEFENDLLNADVMPSDWKNARKEAKKVGIELLPDSLINEKTKKLSKKAKEAINKLDLDESNYMSELDRLGYKEEDILAYGQSLNPNKSQEELQSEYQQMILDKEDPIMSDITSGVEQLNGTVESIYSVIANGNLEKGKATDKDFKGQELRDAVFGKEGVDDTPVDFFNKGLTSNGAEISNDTDFESAQQDAKKIVGDTMDYLHSVRQGLEYAKYFGDADLIEKYTKDAEKAEEAYNYAVEGLNTLNRTWGEKSNDDVLSRSTTSPDTLYELQYGNNPLMNNPIVNGLRQIWSLFDPKHSDWIPPGNYKNDNTYQTDEENTIQATDSDEITHIINDLIAKGYGDAISNLDPAQIAQDSNATEALKNIYNDILQDTTPKPEDLATLNLESLEPTTSFFQNIGTKLKTLYDTFAATDKAALAMDVVPVNDNVSKAITNIGQRLKNWLDKINNVNSESNSNVAPTINSGAQAVSNIANNIPQETESKITVDTSDGEAKITNLKALIDSTVSTIQQGATFKITVNDSGLKNAAKRAESITKAAGNKSLNVTASGADGANKLSAAVKDFSKLSNKTINLTAKATGLSDVHSLTSAVQAFHRLTDKTITLKTIKETVTKGGPGEATGARNHGYFSAPPKAGSAARGSYGQLGPKGKGGLTLTGELGYEIAWIPSENRSMILGANGPQMVNLPGDAVVWTHEQSKRILKQKSIPAGSHAETTPGVWTPGGGGGGGTGGGGGGTRGFSGSTEQKIKDTADKIAKMVGGVCVWWENIARKTEATQRKMDQNQKIFEKYLKRADATLKGAGAEGKGNAYIQKLNQYKGYNEEQFIRAQAELDTINYGTKAQQKAADAIKTAKATKSKTDDKKAKKQMAKANKAAYNKALPGTTQISYKSGKKTKDELINIADYVYFDSKSGSYQISQSKINKIKNKEKRKAVADAANKELNDRISKKNAAEDAIQKAQEALEKMGEELYETFFAWEVELTKIWNITQKIADHQSKQARAEGYTGLLEAQVDSGQISVIDKEGNINTDFIKSVNEAYGKGIQERINVIGLMQEGIGDHIKDLQLLMSSADEQTTLANVKALVANTEAYNTAQESLEVAAEAADEATATIADANSRIKKDKKIINKSNNKTKVKKAKADKKDAQADKAEAEQDLALRQNEINTAQAIIDETMNSGLALLDETQLLAYKQEAKELEDSIKIIDMANSYINKGEGVKVNDDGTLIIDFDTDALEADKQAGKITADTAQKIQDHIQKLVDGSQNLQEAYNNLTSELTELHTTLAGLKEAWAGYSEDLMSYLEEKQQKEIDKLKQLSSAIADQMKNLLDQVKRSLDQRRRQEDNQKTEQDISKKQQRLAALQADTSGGHQVEIAQLQQEITDAQTNYQRTLEDQLLDNLQQNTDIANEQRERQISLQEAILNAVDKASIVNDWMDDPDTYRKNIAAAFYEATNYDNLPLAKQQALDDQFDKLFLGLKTNQEKQESVVDAINATAGAAKLIEQSMGSVGQEVTQTEVKTDVKAIAEELKKDIAGARTAAEDAQTKAIAAGNQATYSSNLAGIHTRQTVNASEFKNMVNYGAAPGVDKNIYQVAHDLAGGDGTGGVTWKEVIQAAKDAGYKPAEIKNWTSDPSSTFIKAFNSIFKAKKGKKTAWESYATGGLADYTGPAWLDGTPSKPELILNAKDTANFIALKDVLAKAMNGIGDTSNTYGDISYEININVDKIEKDYDVDRVVEKVKKEIVKGAGYRNVTQVRSFR